jgi:hypothetical protein
MVGASALIGLAGGCKGDAKSAANDDVSVLVTSNSPADRLAASKRLAAQGDSVIPGILEAFTKAEGKAEAQMALVDAVFRMKPSAAQITALENMAAQTKDKQVSEQAAGFARQRKLSR